MISLLSGAAISLAALPVVLYVTYLCYFYLRHPFWARQYVAHYHSPTTYLRDNRFMTDASMLLAMNRRFLGGPVSVSAHVVDGLHQIPTADEEVGALCALVDGHYLRTPGSRYSPPRKALETLFVGHRAPCCLVLARDADGGAPVAAVTTRPVFSVFRSSYPHHDPDEFRLSMATAMQYVDFLTVARDHRGKGLAPRVISQVIHSWARRALEEAAEPEPDTPPAPAPSFLFKREGHQAPFRAVSRYMTSVYELDTDFLRETVHAFMPAAHPIRRLEAADVGRLGELWSEGTVPGLFTRVFHAGMENIYHQVREKQLAVFLMEDAEEKPLAMYVFQNPHMDTGNDSDGEGDDRDTRSYTNLLCSASWGLENARGDGDGDGNEFAKGALRCLLSLVEEADKGKSDGDVERNGGDDSGGYRHPIGRLIVERVSHNPRVLPFVLSRDRTVSAEEDRDGEGGDVERKERPGPRGAKKLCLPLGDVKTGYYTYNYLCRPTPPEECLFLM